MSKLELTFPQKVAAIILTIVGVFLIFWISLLGVGTVSVTVTNPNSRIVYDDESHASPWTATVRSGKKLIIIQADGYISANETIAVPTFRKSKAYSFTLVDKIINDGGGDKTLLTKYPWIKNLPYSTSQFEVDYPNDVGAFPVTLAPKLLSIPPDSTDVSRNNPPFVPFLAADKKAALAWLKAQGADPSKLTIEWQPYDPDNPPK